MDIDTSIRAVVSEREYRFMTDAQRAAFVASELEPEF